MKKKLREIKFNIVWFFCVDVRLFVCRFFPIALAIGAPIAGCVACSIFASNAVGAESSAQIMRFGKFTFGTWLDSGRMFSFFWLAFGAVACILLLIPSIMFAKRRMKAR